MTSKVKLNHSLKVAVKECSITNDLPLLTSKIFNITHNLFSMCVIMWKIL